MATVDLDKLSAELTAAGYFAEDTHGDGLLKVGTNTYERYTAHCVVSLEGDVHPARNSKVDWTLLDIIRRHVAPVAPDPDDPYLRGYKDGFDSATAPRACYDDDGSTIPCSPDPGLREAIAKRMFEDADAIAVEQGDSPIRWEDFAYQDWYYRRADSALAVLAERGMA